MAVIFTLPEDVRAKYDMPAEVVYDPAVLMLDEAIEVQDTLGVDVSTLAGRLRTEEGKAPDYKAWKLAIWLACRRVGLQVAYADFDLNLLALVASSDQPGEADPKETPTEDPSTPESLSGDEPEASGI